VYSATSRQLSYLCASAVLACSLVYTGALGTGWGLDLDARGLPSGASRLTWTYAHADLRRAFIVGTVATIALAALAAVLLLVRRRRRDLAAVSIATLIGANATTYLLKPLLAGADPLGGEAARGIDASFPSGHASAAMSLALVAVILAPPRRRGPVALVAALYAGCMGVGLVALSFHYPSDVVAGFLWAGAWFAAMTAIIRPRGKQHATAPAPSPRLSLRAIVTGAALAIAIGGLLLLPAKQAEHGVFAVFAFAIAGIAVLLPVGLTALMAQERRAGSGVSGST
jgi:membrane-associated phospholipid phosphatase